MRILMMKKKLITSIFLGFFLVPLIASSYANSYMPEQAIPERNTFNPIVTPNLAKDVNSNKIHDDLEALVDNGYLGDMYSTIATFNQPLTNSLKDAIEARGGQIISSWSIIYGAAIRIKGSDLQSLASIPEITSITEDYKCKALLSTSVPQINVRPYVWDTLGFEGNSDHAIAILDTGYDVTHPDLSGQLLHWEDFTGLSVTPSDLSGHGTHVTSIAVGTGSAGASTDPDVEISGVMSYQNVPMGSGIVSQLEVEDTGTVKIYVQWNERPGPSLTTDQMIVVIDSDQDGAYDDEQVSGPHSSMPLVLTVNDLDPGIYHFVIGSLGNPPDVERASIQYKIERPASTISDGNNKYRGVAPNCQVVSLKVLDDSGAGTSTYFLDATDWIAANGLTYNISVVNMSIEFDAVYSFIDTAVNNLASLGYVCVVAAGNGHLNDDTIVSPGTAAKAITVGAIDDVDKITIYSSNGDTGSGKPDVVAPGGAYKAPIAADEETHLLVAADSNDADIVEFPSGVPDTYWETEFNTNDYIGYQGTSMAAPHVAGIIALMIEAMGNDWGHTEADVLKIKNILCGTATELNAGEVFSTYSNIPTLNRGDRDLVEGFGKVHGDAAIEGFLTEYIAGSIATDSLGSSLGDKQSWARRVELDALIEFTAGIDMDGSADFDLYLYDPSVDVTSGTGILVKSVTNGAGLPENILYTPASDMTAYLVIKRVSGSGSFTLQTEATNTGTPSTSPSFLFGVSTAIWAVLGTIGLASIVLLAKKRRK
jgi:subtilisin family serine protease